MMPAIFLSLVILTAVIIFQFINLIKYNWTNGAFRMRILLMLKSLCLTAHVVSIHLGYNQGYFFLAFLVIFLFMYAKGYLLKMKS